MSNFTQTLVHPNRDSDTDVLYDFINKLDNIQRETFGKDYYFAPKQNILFNKGRYIEFSLWDKELLAFIAKSAKTPIQHKNMIVCTNEKIEAVVRAMNKKGYRCILNLDWI